MEQAEIKKTSDKHMLGVGGGLEYTGAGFLYENNNPQVPIITRDRIEDNRWGVKKYLRTLNPSILLEQLDSYYNGGKVVAIDNKNIAHYERITKSMVENKDCILWTNILRNSQDITIPKNSEVFILWDLEDYYCGYPYVNLDGGDGSKISFTWEESLYEEVNHIKGNRNEIINKFFHGMTDIFNVQSSLKGKEYTNHTWRSGRYIAINIKTKNEELKINKLGIYETRYPIELEGKFLSNDNELNQVMGICERTLMMDAHDFYANSPYYEQLMYVADSRVQALTEFVMHKDDSLNKRIIDLFNFSKSNFDIINMRYPSRELQISTTFSLIWVMMVYDYALWKNNEKFVYKQLLTVRTLLDKIGAFQSKDGLLANVPGWSFVDHFKENGWISGAPPVEKDGVSSLVNLFYLLSLEKAAEIEKWQKEELLSERYNQKIILLKKSIYNKFWNEEKGLLADNSSMKTYSPHAQILAILTDVVSGKEAEILYNYIIKEININDLTYYFRFYLFELFAKMNDSARIINYMDNWKNFVKIGLKAPLEMPEPSRTDCHAWAAHPRYHFIANIAGIKPSKPGFQEVLIAPNLGDLTKIDVSVPHHLGDIELKIDKKNEEYNIFIKLPEGLTGYFNWHEYSFILKEGIKQIVI